MAMNVYGSIVDPSKKSYIVYIAVNIFRFNLCGPFNSPNIWGEGHLPPPPSFLQ